MVPGCDGVTLWFVGTAQKLTVVVEPDPTLVATVVVPVVPVGQFQEVGGVASGSVVMVVVVVVLPLVCEMAKTCADVPLVESAMLAFPAT
jgi:hypothetical protein